MLKKIHLTNSIGFELENKMESGDYRPAKLQDSEVHELEEKAKIILAEERAQE